MIVTFDPPVLVNFAGKVCVLPAVTDPKLKLAGVIVNVPAVTALPVREIASAGEEPVLAITKFRFSLPADCDANATLKDALCPAASVKGKVKPLRL